MAVHYELCNDFGIGIMICGRFQTRALAERAKVSRLGEVWKVRRAKMPAWQYEAWKKDGFPRFLKQYPMP